MVFTSMPAEESTASMNWHMADSSSTTRALVGILCSHLIGKINRPRSGQPTLQTSAEHVKINRLGNKAIAAGLKDAALFGHHCVGGYGNDGNALKPCFPAHPLGKL